MSIKGKSGKTVKLIKEDGRYRYLPSVSSMGSKFISPEFSERWHGRDNVTYPVKRAIDGSEGLEKGDEGARDHTFVNLKVVEEDIQVMCIGSTVTGVDIDLEYHNIPKDRDIKLRDDWQP